MTKIKCIPKNNSYAYVQFLEIYFYIDTIVYSLLPFFIMITCNFMIIGKIVKSRVRSKQVIITRVKNTNKTRIIKNMPGSMLATEKRLSFTLLSISLSFLFFTIPVFVIEQIQKYLNENEMTENWKIITSLGYMLMYLNHVINFFFYCLLGPKFRNEVKRLIPFLNSNANKVHPGISKRQTLYLPSSGCIKKETNLVVSHKNDFISNETNSAKVIRIKRLSQLKEAIETERSKHDDKSIELTQLMNK
jgi:hypothetical protein